MEEGDDAQRRTTTHKMMRTPVQNPSIKLNLPVHLLKRKRLQDELGAKHAGGGAWFGGKESSPSATSLWCESTLSADAFIVFYLCVLS